MATTSDQPLYLQIREQLIERFADYPLDTQLPTNRDLAQEFGVALLTVKRAMDTLARDGYIDRRQGKGTFLRAHERQIQRSDPTDRPNGRLLVAVPSFYSYEYWRRVDDAAELALRRGYGLAEYRFRRETTYVDFIAAARAIDKLQGVLIDPVPDTLGARAVQQLDTLGVPVVVFSHCQEARTTANLVTIQPDWYQAGYKLAEELLTAGHRRIGFVEAEPPGQDGNRRLAGRRRSRQARPPALASDQPSVGGERRRGPGRGPRVAGRRGDGTDLRRHRQRPAGLPRDPGTGPDLPARRQRGRQRGLQRPRGLVPPAPDHGGHRHPGRDGTGAGPGLQQQRRHADPHLRVRRDGHATRQRGSAARVITPASRHPDRGSERRSERQK